MAKRNKPPDYPKFSGPKSAKYEVGYGKPPKETRFKPGQSGNPRGRRKGAKNKTPALNEERLKTIILKEAYRTIKVNDGDKPVTVPMAQAIVRTLAINAARGNARAQRLFTDLLTTTERENKRLHDEWLDTAITYKIEWEKELARREATGAAGPEPLPHPDDIIIDMNTGGVIIKGPMTKEDKAKWDLARERRAESDRTIAELEQLLRDDPDYDYKDQVLDEIAHERKIRAIIDRVVPD